MRSLARLAAAAAVALAASTGAQATTVALTASDLGQWKVIDAFDDVAPLPITWIDVNYSGDFSTLSFTVTLATDAYLKVVDSGFAGDVFRVFDNGTALGTTSTPTDTYPVGAGSGFALGSSSADLDAAFADARFSQGTWLLTAGSHVITGTVVSSTATGLYQYATTGGIQITPVPEPETAGILLAGLALVGAIRRRRA